VALNVALQQGGWFRLLPPVHFCQFILEGTTAERRRREVVPVVIFVLFIFVLFYRPAKLAVKIALTRQIGGQGIARRRNIVVLTAKLAPKLDLVVLLHVPDGARAEAFAPVEPANAMRRIRSGAVCAAANDSGTCICADRGMAKRQFILEGTSAAGVRLLTSFCPIGAPIWPLKWHCSSPRLGLILSRLDTGSSTTPLYRSPPQIGAGTSRRVGYIGATGCSESCSASGTAEACSRPATLRRQADTGVSPPQFPAGVTRQLYVQLLSGRRALLRGVG